MGWVEGDAELVCHGVRFVLHGVARIGDGQRAAGRRAALLDDVRELVRDQVVAVGRAGLYWSCAK